MSRVDRKDKKKEKSGIKHWEVIALYLIIYDIITINLSYFLGLWIRFDLHFSAIPYEYFYSYLKFTPIYCVIALIVYYFLGLYNSLWRFASFSELNRVILAWAVTTAIQIIGITVFVRRMPISYYIIGAFFQLFFTTVIRFAYRYITLLRTTRENQETAKHNVMIIGAGSSGQMIIRELKHSDKLHSIPRCVIDDNPNKWRRTMEGVPIVGGRDDIMHAVEKYHIDLIYFCIPSATPVQRRDFLNICKETGCELKALPGVYQLANGEVAVSKMKPVAIEDLLGRDPIKVDMTGIFNSLKGKRILVTGGGGSIGSELCRQIAAHQPEQLIIFDIYENNAYDIQQELKRKYGNKLNLVVLIGSVRDSRRLDMIFDQYRPQIVYHAAAHKHVPLMEDSPNEAIKNNVVGTYKTAYTALKYHVEKFVLISTDKAVNPTNIMGASKRLCEMVIQSMNKISETGAFNKLPFLHAHLDKVVAGQVTHDPEDHMAVEGREFHTEHNTQFVAVRFGNVLGSNGSVIPLFKKQIMEGGPVTVTHPDIIRYFMTIPEAVSLVLEAGTYAKGGEIFILDMGQPMKIDTLARNLIKLSGYTPDVDIKIEYTGLRPGEKLYEEKLMAEEGMKKTANDLIHIGQPIPFDVDTFLHQLEDLAEASYNNAPDIVNKVEEVVTTFHPVGQHPTGNEMDSVKEKTTCNRALQGKEVAAS
jgi:FlaA1/EpsC-like NDP-sugar epimerase